MSTKVTSVTASLLGIATTMALASAFAAQSGRTKLSTPGKRRDIKALSRPEFVIGPAIRLPIEGSPQQLWASAALDDPDKLLACTFESDHSKARFTSAAYVSLDGGNTWMRTLHDTHSEWVSETACAEGSEGRAYFVAGVSDTSQGSMRHEWGSMEAYRSSDGGLNWGQPRRYPFIDWMTLGVTATATKDLVYLFGNAQAAGIGDAGAGGWLEKRKPMLSSTDGLAFSPPVFPQDSQASNLKHAFPLGAVVLNSGQVLALFAEMPPANFALYRYDGSTYQLSSRIALPEGVVPYGPLSAHMSLDHTGRFNGRLYAAIPALEGDNPVLVVAHSDDQGHSWVSRVLLRREAEIKRDEIEYFYAGVAVNPAGIVGLEWFSGADCKFAISSDGGESVDNTRILGNCAPWHSVPLATAAYLKTYNDRSAADHPLWYSPHSPPGLTIQVGASTLSSVQVAADAAGRFHAFWSELHEDAVTTLTATISTSRPKLETISFVDSEEITNRSIIRVEDEEFDPRSEVFSLNVSVRNTDSTAIPYPRFLEVSGDRSDCGGIKYLNPSAVSNGSKAVFRVAARPDRKTLFPGESSLPVHMGVFVEGCDPHVLMNKGRTLALENTPLFPLAVRFRIWAASH